MHARAYKIYTIYDDNISDKGRDFTGTTERKDAFIKYHYLLYLYMYTYNCMHAYMLSYCILTNFIDKSC